MAGSFVPQLLLALILACTSVFPSLSFAQSGFDFFYFVQQWPGSYCDLKQACCYPTTGKPASDFSIHGLWPNYNDGSYPSNCAGSSYESALISDLKEELQAYWDTLACPSGDGEKFWSHEWEKHGTCSGLDERSYFESTLALRKSIDLLAALQSAGIEPDDGSYEVEDVQEALKQAIGHRPGLECNTNISGKRQLYQVYVCVDTDASTLIDCPIFPSTSCPSSVTFPSF
ncbi:hypothetical protein GOP47_0025897 [Adiantum capillus-veneris]|uniref:Uncharacterized protein n=1 Tax=Adiantum capillus-veneris TaxID=13818 RepID=A0A9D4U1B8_ADICA|nr:hypothetical protein GOP47_0025897 [Adiantum capillus-veneris]